ncbi:hypothetical protein KXD93_14610 [Mucilaginibacter sp. BJC16-A38]|uniref:hypothetical protein n=1 Tax=Mucilaginibacter phenanthrenivorans TaxID=1234842 RepID=UPI00215728FD|nr:hypothetical protein [Mucilaginibacter phenanthrenivorans]MCR8558885.1 hypothetical protein [Mucilaginibacter phenanthrenivorans]
MKKQLFTFLILLLTGFAATAQNQEYIKPLGSGGGSAPQPFLFSVNTLTAESAGWSANYTGAYGERTAGPFGYDGVDQQFAVKGYLGNRFTLFANADLGVSNKGGTESAQQAEVIHDFVGGNKLFGSRFGLGFGVNRDFSNTGAIFSRVTASFEAASWRIGGNMRFEKAFSKTRDNIDLVTSVGFQHRIAGPVFAGFEAVGEDLEGFWESDEAEGGAKLLVGPSINFAPANSKFAFSVCGGPVFYATHSTVIPSEAIRDVGTVASQNGYTIRAMVSFNLHK